MGSAAIMIDGQYWMTMDILNRRIGEGKPNREGRMNRQTWSNYFKGGKSKEEQDSISKPCDIPTKPVVTVVTVVMCSCV
jgi:hypothetical protein